jgi:virginiamycin B lyase
LGASHRIGRISPTGEIEEFNLPKPASQPVLIKTGPDKNLWFGELRGNRIGRITPQGKITEFDIPTKDSQPRGLAFGPDGNLWFSEQRGNSIGRLQLK